MLYFVYIDQNVLLRAVKKPYRKVRAAAFAAVLEHVKEPVCSRSYGKEDTVKETQEGCLSRPIRKNLNFFESSDF